jgi:DNA-binding PadR family transcriptional regulator
VIKYAFLGLLLEGKDYGYSLKNRFEETLGPVWKLKTGQVYQTLQALKREGLVAEARTGETPPDPDPGRPRQFVAVTPKGVRAFERWLKRPPSGSRHAREEMLLRLLVLKPERNTVAIEQLRRLAHVYTKRIALLVRLKRNLPEELTDGELLRDICLEAGIRHAEAHLKWLDYTRERLERATSDALKGAKPSRAC